jgi:hypothetical protein
VRNHTRRLQGCIGAQGVFWAELYPPLQH